MAAAPLMPKATAVWLIDNTKLTFEQIAEFCGLHKLQVQAIADGESEIGIVGMDPIVQTNQLSADEIKRCENDPRARLKMLKSDLPQPVTRTKGPRYTPVSKRADRPDAIAYLIKTYPELIDAQIARLVGTTKDTIEKVRNRTHWNASNIKPHNPVLLGLCKQSDLDAALKRAQRRVAREQAAGGVQPEDSQPDGSGEQPSLEHSEMPEMQTNEGEAAADMGKQDQPDINPDDVFRNMG
jgi:hypothetical protein